MKMSKKGQMMGKVLAVIFGTILLVAVAIPVSNDLLNAQTNVTINTSVNCSPCTALQNDINGTLTRTVVGFIPVFFAMAGLTLAAALVK